MSKALGLFALLLGALFVICLVPNESSAQGAQPVREKYVNVGDVAPDFTLPAYPSGDLTLSEHRGHTMILFFYPGDNTPVCTAEAIAFTENLDAFESYGAMVYGISKDSLESHEAFSLEHDLAVPLLSDRNGKVRRLFGNPDGSHPLEQRITYVIDSDGIIRDIIVSEEAEDHVMQSLEWAERLAEEDSASTESGSSSDY
jgi:peroxiredoxin Q/BCP